MEHVTDCLRNNCWEMANPFSIQKERNKKKFIKGLNVWHMTLPSNPHSSGCPLLPDEEACNCGDECARTRSMLTQNVLRGSNFQEGEAIMVIDMINSTM